MPFELGQTINGGAEWLCGSSLANKVLSNPVVTALLITALALVIIYAMYRENLKGTGWRRGVKTGVWLAIGVSALVFVHYYALERHLSKDHASQGVRDVMASIHHSATTGGGYSVLAGGAWRGDEEGVSPAAGAPAVSAATISAAAGRPAAWRPDNVGEPRPGSAMDELGLERVVLASTPGARA